MSRSFTDDETIPWSSDSGSRRLVVYIIGPAGTESHRVTGPSCTLGRADEADLQVDDPALSRLHLELRFEPGLSVVELGSRNGSRLAGMLLAPQQATPLGLGQPISCGGTTVVVQPMQGITTAASDYQAALAQGGFQLVSLAFDRNHQGRVELTLSDLLEADDLVCELEPGFFEVALQGDTVDSAEALQSSLRFALGEIKIDVEPRTDSEVTGLSSPTGALVVSSKLREVFEQAIRTASNTLPVLITGETGVGKEVLARAIHEHSNRSTGPFVALNCGGLTPSLLESELFGHERGAFTGAVVTKAGLFESADQGTLLLDELGEMPNETQVKLLRVLESRTVRRVGGSQEIPVDVRVLSATHRDLKQEVSAGRFREDLYYRLEGFRLHIPPLRERRADIVPLALAFTQEAAAEEGRDPPRLSAAARTELERRSWPGNARELRNALRRAVVLADALIEIKHLPEVELEEMVSDSGPQLPQQIDSLERTRILTALEAAGGNQSQAARALGISRKTLIRRLDKYGVPRPRKNKQSGD